MLIEGPEGVRRLGVSPRSSNSIALLAYVLHGFSGNRWTDGRGRLDGMSSRFKCRCRSEWPALLVRKGFPSTEHGGEWSWWHSRGIFLGYTVLSTIETKSQQHEQAIL